MKFIIKKLSLLLVAYAMAASPLTVAAQRGSEKSELKQTISGTDIVIKYSRPSVRDREPVFGGLEKWGHIWTPGANMATTFHFSENVWLNDTEVEEGTYSVWFQLNQDAPWLLMLHPDSTRGHLPAPSLDEAFLTVEVSPEPYGEYTETLTFDIDNIRATGGVLQFRWASTLVPVQLRVDPGYEFEFDAAAAQPFVGNWLLDQSMSAPPDSVIASMKASSPEEEHAKLDEWIREWFLEPKSLRLEFEPDSGIMRIVDTRREERSEDDENVYGSLLIKKGPGIFTSGGTINGELTTGSDGTFWEFEFDDDGIAQRFVKRDARTDEIEGVAERVK